MGVSFDSQKNTKLSCYTDKLLPILDLTDVLAYQARAKYLLFFSYLSKNLSRLSCALRVVIAIILLFYCFIISNESYS